MRDVVQGKAMHSRTQLHVRAGENAMPRRGSCQRVNYSGSKEHKLIVEATHALRRGNVTV